MSRSALIAILPGDGIGPEVTQQAVRVLREVAAQAGHQLTFEQGLIGGAAIDAEGSSMPQQTVSLCSQADAILLGAVGGPKWSDPEALVRPEQGLLALRKKFGLFANLRPVCPNPRLNDASPIKPEYLDGVDLLVVRELTGGIYFGDKERGEAHASDTCRYGLHEIERVVRLACALAQRRRGKLTSVDKANVLETSRLWRATVDRICGKEFPELEVEHLLVDAATMHLLTRPRDFDVIVTENMFGDILTDEASVLAGSLGLLPSASLAQSDGDHAFGLFEPIHGSAPDIAGLGVANPYGAILSAAMLLRHSLGLDVEALRVEAAVDAAIAAGALTRDLAGPGGVTTVEVGDAVIAAL